MAQKGDLMTARSDIRVLDATIRDGGLVNNFYVLPMKFYHENLYRSQCKGRR